MPLPAPLLFMTNSCRQVALFQKLNFPFQVLPFPDVVIPLPQESPLLHVKRVVQHRLLSLHPQCPHGKLFTTYTVCVVGTRFLKAASTQEDAKAHMMLLSGRRHRVYTAIALFSEATSPIRYRVLQAHIGFKQLDDRDVNAFLSSEEWKFSTIYDPQGIAGRFICSFRGLPEVPLGVPLYPTYSLLTAHL